MSRQCIGVTLIVAASGFATLGCGGSGTRPLNVDAAASLRDAFPAIDRGPAYNFAGSDQLQVQVERGAPADVFASASPKQAQALYSAGRCSRPVSFATNRLVIVVPNGNPGHVRSLDSLRRGGLRLAVGNAGVPIGAYTRTLLAKLHRSSILSANTVSQEADVAGITAKVALGSADAGFVYVTDARGARGRVTVVELARAAQPPIQYEICAVKRSGASTQAAQRFIDRVRSSSGQAALARFGFGVVSGP